MVEPLNKRDTGFVMAFPRTRHLLAGAVAGLGSALWLNAAGPLAGVVAVGSVLTLVHTLALALIAVLAMLVTTAGTLVAADWRADVQSRHAWAQIDVAAVAELSLDAGAATPSQIESRYPSPVDNEALRSVFRAHRFASPAPTPEPMPARLAAVHPTRLAEPGEPILAPSLPAAAAKISCDNATNTAVVSEIAIPRQATGKTESATRAEAPVLVAAYRGPPQPRRVKQAPSRTRLLVYASTWSGWPARDRCILTHAPPGGHIADIVVLGSHRNDRDRREPLPHPSTSDNIARNAGPPSCRGPPPIESGRQRRAGALPLGDPVVRDNLGKRVPVCAAELDVIATYLDQALRDLVVSATAAPKQEKT